MFSDLKGRATKAKDFGVTKFNTTREHMKSQPSKNINWDPNHKRPPPPPPAPRPKPQFAPPPSRTTSGFGHSPSQSDASPVASPSSPTASVPPPFVKRNIRSDSASPPIPPNRPSVPRSSKPDSVSPPAPPSRPPAYHSPSPSIQAGAQEANRIDWANLTPEDKEVFFSWLDEFFSKRFNIAMSPRAVEEPPRPPPMPVAAPKPRVPFNTGGPPKIPKWTKPAIPSPALSASVDEDFTLSYPPSTEHGSAGLDLAHYFAPSTHWDSAWYASENPLQAPPLKGNREIRMTGSMQTYGNTKTVWGGVFYSDLSMCWWSVEFPLNFQADPNDSRSVKRDAQYLPRPAPMDRAALIEAHETYGETIAAFAESFEDTGEYCSRGECWDLAHKAIEYFEEFDYIPQPVPSISRTHGHLIFEGKATGKGNVQYGRWRGGDDRVRRGDIVEWRSVKISMSKGAQTWTQRLGDPDHTAVIVKDSVPSVSVADGQSVRPGDLGILEVVEQSVSTGKTPHRSTYTLSGLEEGEMWIYRPVSMMAYVGCMLEVKVPEGVNALRI